MISVAFELKIHLKLVSSSNNSIKSHIIDIRNDDPVFVSIALIESFVSNFSTNIHSPFDIFAI